MFFTYVLKPFQEVIRKFPDRNSFLINDVFYSYLELAQQVSKIRIALQSHEGVGKNIGLVANDDIETYAAIFAIWMEGLAYVPLHPSHPIDRSLEIISQAGISLVIDSSPETIYESVSVIHSAKLKFKKYALEAGDTDDEELAYILFTSGSTGKPKGVQITRKNVGAFMRSFWATGIQTDENDRCLQCFDLTFDVSVQSFLVPLTTGACAYTIPHSQIKYSYIYGLLEDHHLTFGAMPPSMIRYLRPYFDEINAPDMRYNILTAEASPIKLIDEWAKCIPNAEIFDFYGPTEATIYCTYQKYKRSGFNKQLNGMMSIGKPMNGMKAIVTDEGRHPLKANEKGELCISGDQLTTGYWRNPEKNEDSFFEMDTKGTVSRFYRTGDYCYIDDEGDIMLAGRMDYQVKIQGYRIELDEIEYHAREFLNGQNAVAISYNNKIGNSEIALFIEGAIGSEAALRAYLNSKMPFYMIPSQIIVKNIFSLNTSGKIDRLFLKGQLTI